MRNGGSQDWRRPSLPPSEWGVIIDYDDCWGRALLGGCLPDVSSPKTPRVLDDHLEVD